LLRVWPARFARQHGPLRPVVERVLRGFMRCGLVEHGFARLWCPSCEKKRQILWAEWLQREVLEPVPHRHVVLTMPRLLRGIFRKRRDLLLDLAQCAAEAVAEYVRRGVGADTRPGIVVSIATRRRLGKAIEDVAYYLVRSPLSLKKLVYLDGQKAVLYRSRMNPSLGRNFEAMDPLEWLARMTDHIPDPGRHRTHFHGFYASRVRAVRREADPSGVAGEPAPAKRRCSPSWARLIAKVYQADPLACKACGGPLEIVAYITDELSITRILDHLGLSPPPQEKPPPTRELIRVPVDEEGRELQAG
jgi:hypothetical protein